ncbi:hypothetical protein C3747_140g64 [Trypanosoma cruzi]|uniref:Pentacotripeptide-repeat region of PRORP domain-containing protein n=2 Tax=Trypanosoma cruzi TaxID=5693 RepID=Q4DFB3_TRYCC|nr:hypothetical protein, conserved [Trypanosoma cruzi]EAN91210.1 hypothetical protein, conserved [Trypanosoma cruzi]PWV04959.1 hypothetical protein C3747_140g64 [Trypanosoma cruzi]RNC60925.1 hypothetical protein TcCL_ESM01387 [Trypanosoma cruzi]|eukprot:XP_813061.1 hypothetical protein [Trypanosoma cruzi strain CL Brener]
MTAVFFHSPSHFAHCVCGGMRVFSDAYCWPRVSRFVHAVRWFSTSGVGGATPASRAEMSHVKPASSSSELWRSGEDSRTVTIGRPHVEATTPEQVEKTFRLSVLARTASNVQLRRYLEQLQPKDHALALAAVRGAEAGGLRVDAKTNEVHLMKLMDGGQLRASMELYRRMIDRRMTPTANTYATLMHMCIQREMPEACQKMFEEMVKRGQSPNTKNYELYITSLAMENPPKWEKAVEVFDHISRDRRGKHLTAMTYNSLMRVYLNMTPFDWRVVYNCYHELRNRKPPILLQWESYLLVAEALRRGRVGYIRRFITYLDAWFCVTPIRSVEFLFGMALYVGAMLVLKAIISWLVVIYYERVIAAKKGVSESIL